MTLALYHNDLSTCAQKVRLVLAEKELRFDSNLLDLRAGDQRTDAYRALNAKGVVPTLVDGDCVITESTIICEYLEDAYPTVSLAPAPACSRSSMRLWNRRIDDGLHGATGILSYAIAFRHDHLSRPDGGQEMLDATKDPQERMVRAGLLEHGLEFPAVGAALARWTAALADVEAALADTEYLAGDYSLPDACWTPYLNRLQHLGLNWLWDGRPRTAAWWQHLRARRSFVTAILEVEQPEKVQAMKTAGVAASDRISEWRNTV